MDRRLKITLITLLIILLSIISFVGLFIQDTKFMKNKLPDYQLGMDLEGYRNVTIRVSEATETIYYDAEGNEVEEEVEDGTSKEVPINNEEVLTKENYTKTKQIIENRLSDLKVSEYLIRLNEDNGTITVQLPEDDIVGIAAQFIYTVGKLTIEDEDGQVLLDNSNLDEVQIGYETGTSETDVYFNLIFNDDSTEKVKEISNTYVSSTNEEGETTSKKVIMKVDGNVLSEKTFDEESSDGTIRMTLGTSESIDTINAYLNQASNIAILLNNGNLPITYNVEQRFVKSDLTLEDAVVPAIVLGIILVIAFIFLIIKYKKLGLLGIISYIGYMAIFLILIRYTNLVITIEGICGILISAILNYILLIYILQILSKTDKDLVKYKNEYNKAMVSMILVLIPTLIIGIILCFATWLPIYSFGTIIFWGVLTMAIYNAIITRILFLNSIKE